MNQKKVVGEEYWYCINCKGWGAKVVDEPILPICYSSHRVIKVRDNGGVGIPMEIKKPEARVMVVFT